MSRKSVGDLLFWLSATNDCGVDEQLRLRHGPNGCALEIWIGFDAFPVSFRVQKRTLDPRVFVCFIHHSKIK